MKSAKLLKSLVIALALTVFVVGCEGEYIETIPVQGTVTLNDEPVENASVAFVPQSPGGQPAYSNTTSDGTYNLQTLLGAPGAGTTAGDYAVVITKSVLQETGRTIKDPVSGQSYPETRGKEVMPRAYTKASTTPFKVTVSEGQENVFDFDMKSTD
ncbi:hypothetical protein AB1K70_25535 [Bremerella sp. JC770]|uniref:hypothetical protein n=1 Tax=Bremerella sp. JC770 TaxID=3232137 RepID=UPI003459AEC3